MRHNKKSEGSSERKHRKDVEAPRNAGFTFIEAVISLVVLALLALAVGASLNSSLSSAHQSNHIGRAGRFLEGTLGSLDSQSYANLLVMNGNQFYDTPVAANAMYRIDLTVSTQAPDLLKITSRLIDQRTNKEVTRVVTYRSQR